MKNFTIRLLTLSLSLFAAILIFQPRQTSASTSYPQFETPSSVKDHRSNFVPGYSQSVFLTKVKPDYLRGSDDSWAEGIFYTPSSYSARLTSSVTGFIEICKYQSGTGLSGFFRFELTGGTIHTLPVGFCTGPIQVPAGSMRITELDSLNVPPGDSNSFRRQSPLARPEVSTRPI